MLLAFLTHQYKENLKCSDFTAVAIIFKAVPQLRIITVSCLTSRSRTSEKNDVIVTVADGICIAADV